MNYEEKLERMDRHLAEHPKDYQTVIARLKTYSDAVEHERKKRIQMRLANVAKYRRMRNEKHNVE